MEDGEDWDHHHEPALALIGINPSRIGKFFSLFFSIASNENLYSSKNGHLFYYHDLQNILKFIVEVAMKLSEIRTIMNFAGAVVVCFILAVAAEKPRVVILSDISNEPDDQMSFVRVLTYANEIDLEGLIATTGCWKTTDPDMDSLRALIKAYGKVYDTLKMHSTDYPTAEYLQSIAKAGVNGFGMSAAASQLDNEAIKLIIAVLEKNDPRPVWFPIWGGANTLGGAVMKIKKEKDAATADALVAKIRAYDIAIQDDGSSYIAHEFPKAKLLTSKVMWRGISHSTTMNPIDPESWGGNNDVFNEEWCDQNVRKDHGPLGKMYRYAQWRWEGDTPSFLYLLPNGLNFPENQTYGGWGGRFEAEKRQNVRSGTGSGMMTDQYLDKYKDYWLYMEAKDTWTYKNTRTNKDTTYTNNEYATVFRWREDYQNDFQARMDRCVKPFAEVNHNPRGVINNDSTLDMIALTAEPGSTLSLDASKSTDPDNNTLTYSWFVYKEPGTYQKAVTIKDETTSKVSLTVPADALDKTIHVILSLKDNGTPPLFGYRRVVVTGGTPSGTISQSINKNLRPSAIAIRSIAKRTLRVTFPLESEYGIRIHSINGRLITRQQGFGKEATDIPLWGTAGAYIVTVIQAGLRVDRTVVIQ
jgi:hypothetical protein